MLGRGGDGVGTGGGGGVGGGGGGRGEQLGHLRETVGLALEQVQQHGQLRLIQACRATRTERGMEEREEG